MIYPLCKRFTYWPQVVLGICFNWGMLMAWSDTQNAVPLPAIAMWLVLVGSLAVEPRHGRHQREDVLRPLRLRNAEKHERHDQPENHEQRGAGVSPPLGWEGGNQAG